MFPSLKIWGVWLYFSATSQLVSYLWHFRFDPIKNLFVWWKVGSISLNLWVPYPFLKLGYLFGRKRERKKSSLWACQFSFKMRRKHSEKTDSFRMVGPMGFLEELWSCLFSNFNFSCQTGPKAMWSWVLCQFGFLACVLLGDMSLIRTVWWIR